MARLEDITSGAFVKGIVSNDIVEIISVKWYGNNVIEVFYKTNSGNVGNIIRYRDDEKSLEVMDKKLSWTFDADGKLMRLVSEAYRIHLAHIFDPYLAVHTSAIEPLPHQISAVYGEMLPRLQLRYILADDPGAGKTIMTGLLIKELMIRGDLKRCLIVAPGSLCEQWQDELYTKFQLRFEILTNDRIETAITGNTFNEMELCIARLDKLARDENLQQKLKAAQEYDLIVVDEAHKMSAAFWGGEIRYTKRFHLGKLLSNITRHFLLLTATPHNGKDEDFQLFLSLIDADRFENVGRTANHSIDVSDIMRRLVKEDLLKFDGTPLFPERRAYTVNYDLSPKEAVLYEEVTEYVRKEFNLADKLEGNRKHTVGFALTILQRRLASSPEAIYQSLRRRRDRLENRLAEERIGKRAADYQNKYSLSDDYDEDDFSATELEEMSEILSNQSSTANTIPELEAEINTLKHLEQLANEVRMSGEDRKWEELSKLLQGNSNMFEADGERKKLIIFTEHKDTLRYLATKIRNLLGDEESVVTIHGGMLRDERRKAEELFRNDKRVRVLIATDAAGEGINLQRAHLMINIDLPWNPNRLEQRFGRIHRIGQSEVCHLWNLVAKDTREGAVFQRLFDKLEAAREALGGKVFDVLGKITFDNRPLRELLIDAVRYGEDKSRLTQVVDNVDNALEREKLIKLIEERALTRDSMDISKVVKIREDMERMEAHKLQPYFIESFFIAAAKKLGCNIAPREKGRYEITHVSRKIRERDAQVGYKEPVLKKYERICFEKSLCNIEGKIPATLIAPGHPLLEVVIDLVREQNYDVLKRGAIFVDENDSSKTARLLFYIEESIRDGVILRDGSQRVISKRVHFVEIHEDGTANNAGYAPYLDYRSATEEESKIILEYVKSQKWLSGDIDNLAINYAVSKIIPEHIEQVKFERKQLIDKIYSAVKTRLTAAIQYWDYRAGELKEEEKLGKVNATLNSQNARYRADELELRMKRRLDELESARNISAMSPIIIAGALIIPKCLLNKFSGSVEMFSHDDKRNIEIAAMNAVMRVERNLGFAPFDVSAKKCGYDIESKIPEDKRTNGVSLRFIEVKGRQKGAETITVSKNEILTALNKPEEFILAIVEVDNDNAHTIYIKRPFKNAPDFSATSINYNIAELMNFGNVIFDEES